MALHAQSIELFPGTQTC